MELINELYKRKETGDAGSEPIDVISVSNELSLASDYNVDCRNIQRKALEESILPLRYLRNFGTVGFEGQLKLLDSTVAIVGLGGLGGLIAELLSRMGVGHLVLVDEDSFEDNNLNRQLFSTEEDLGKSKAECAQQRISKINSGTSVTLFPGRLTLENSEEILSSCNIVVDALDNISGRFVLQKTARTLGIPMVHGAIGGFLGQVGTIFPEDRGLYAFYPEGENTPDRLVEAILGNPAATPAMVGSWQAQETIKYIIGQGELLRNRMLFFDALTASAEILEY